MKRKLILEILLVIATTTSVYANGLWRDKIIASDAEIHDYFGLSVSVWGNICIVGAPGDDFGANQTGSAYIFELNGSGWTQAQKLVAPDPSLGAFFGGSVSISDGVCIVGANIGHNNGSAYIFRLDGYDSWIQEQQIIFPVTDNVTAVASVCIDHNVCIIGCSEKGTGGDWPISGPGMAYVFRFDGSSWNQEQKLTASDAEMGDNFGSTVSINGDLCIIGASGNDDNGYHSGSAYIFRFDGSSWSQEQKLTASDANSYDQFGRKVCIRNNVCVVGAPYDDDNGEDSGAAYIFRFDGSNWSQEQKLLPSDGTAESDFGQSVSINGDDCVIGAPRDNMWSGAAYLFHFNGYEWIQSQKLTAFDIAEWEEFGGSVFLGLDNIIVGAYRANNDKGAVYTFRPSPTADLNGDCFVDLADLAIIAGQWLTGENLP